jgi:Co/Zn/Cd efflux system component
MTTKLNFRIGNNNGNSSISSTGRKTPDYVYDQILSWQVESIQSSPQSVSRRSRTLSGASSSLASIVSGGGSINAASPGATKTIRRNNSHSRIHGHAGSPHGHVKEIEMPRSRLSSYDEEDYEYDNDEYSFGSNSEGEDDLQEYSSNERLLLIAFLSFMSFSATQLYFAFRAESAAMKGDSAAMIVDSLTYLFNYCAERSKHTYDKRHVDAPASRHNTGSGTTTTLSPAMAHYRKQRNKRKKILQLEIIPPFISVSTLLVVTGIVFHNSLRVIWWDLSQNVNHIQGDPNIDLMMAFAIVNLLLDFFNFTCFAKSNHLFGYDTEVVKGKQRHNYNNHSFSTHEDNDDGDDEEEDDYPFALVENDTDAFDEDEKAFMNNNSQRSRLHHQSHANLNMVSVVVQNA